jgi:hypothetical protein
MCCALIVERPGMQRSRGFLAFFVVLMLLGLLASSCTSDEITLQDVPTSTPTAQAADIPDEGEIDNGFSSDDPNVQSLKTTPPTDPLRPGASGGGDSNDPVFADEQDIVQVDGTTLFAVSRRGGLVVADISNPNQPTVLSRNALQNALPVALHIESRSRAFVLLNDVQHFTSSTDGFEGSAIVAFDISDPAKTRPIARYNIEGMIKASKMAAYGEAIFVVIYQWGTCWNCPKDSATVVTSLSLKRSTPNIIAPIQTQRFTRLLSPYWAEKTVRFSEQFLYLAGASQDWASPSSNWPTTEIDPIEILRDGTFKTAEPFRVAGQIRHDWQIDEGTDGVLRLVSEYVDSNGLAVNYPSVATFSNDPIFRLPLGSRTFVLPGSIQQQKLKMVRFRGNRAYVVGRDVSTHIAILDLSDAKILKSSLYPVQLQQTLDIRPTGPSSGGGDQVAVLGFDSTNRLNVSLIDTTTNIALPTRLATVSLPGPGDTGTLKPDASSLRLIEVGDSVRLLAIPFAHHSHWRGACEIPKPSVGVQLVDLTSSSLLMARGLVGLPTSEPPVNILANGTAGDPTHLIVSSPRSAASVDIRDHSAPILRTKRIQRSNPTRRLVETANHLAIVTSDPFTGEPVLALTPKGVESADDSNFVGQVSLASLDTDSIPAKCDHPNRWFGWDDIRLFAGKPGSNVVYAIVPSFVYEWLDPKDTTGPIQHGKVIAAAIDIADPSSPKIAGTVEVTLPDQITQYGLASSLDRRAFAGSNTSPLVTSGDGVVQVGPSRDRLVFLSVENVATPVPLAPTALYNKVLRRLHVIDFADPTHPIAQPPLPLRDSLGTMPLVVDPTVADGSTTVMTTRWVKYVGGSVGQVKFYVDRINAGSESKSAPTELASINIPGSLIARVGDRFVTTGYRLVERASFQPIERHLELSKFFRPRLRVISEKSVSLASQNLSNNALVQGDRIYVSHPTRYELNPEIEVGGFWVFGGIAEGQLSIVSQLAEGDDFALAANGTRVAIYNRSFDNAFRIFDTKTAVPTLLAEKDSVRVLDSDSTQVLLTNDGTAYLSIEGVGLETLAAPR